MGGSKYIKQHNISLARQAAHLMEEYPESRCTIHHNKLLWEGVLRPTPLSREYNIRIICKGFLGRPKVLLHGDCIKGIEKENFPHHFKIDKRKNEVELCLHMFYEFSYKHDWIADTIVPWTQEWLFFYEIWLATNEWCGGGHTPVSYEE